MPDSRAHHFVPQCWLSGFAGTGTDEGFLYVTDLKRKKQFRCKPSEVGHRRDYNRIEHPDVEDPLAVEKAFAKIESIVAPILKLLADERRGVQTDTELSILVEFMAIQVIRVPAFRSFLKRTTMKVLREKLLKDEETWENALRAASIALDSPGANYSTMIRAVDGGHISVADDPAFHLLHGAKHLNPLDDALKGRVWNELISTKGLFIGSDNPVLLDGEESHTLGFSDAPLVIFPVNRFLLLYGTLEQIQSIPVTIKLIAQTNSFFMMNAVEQVFSSRPEFYWLDSNGSCQTDWRLFDRSDFREVN